MIRLAVFFALIMGSVPVGAVAWESKDVRAVQARYGDCVVKREYAAARRFVLDPNLPEAEWRKALDKVVDGDCLNIASKWVSGAQMKLPLDTMRYVLADALVRKDFVAPSADVATAAALIQPTFDAAEYEPKAGKKLSKDELEKLQFIRDKRIALVFLSEFGECVVRGDPNLSHGLLRSAADSAEERAAFAALVPQFGNCLSAGQKLSFSKATLRGTIAMNYYRLALAPRASAAAAGAVK